MASDTGEAVCIRIAAAVVLTFTSICRACKPARCYLNYLYCDHTLDVKVCCPAGCTRTLTRAQRSSWKLWRMCSRSPHRRGVELETIFKDMEFLSQLLKVEVPALQGVQEF